MSFTSLKDQQPSLTSGYHWIDLQPIRTLSDTSAAIGDENILTAFPSGAAGRCYRALL